MPHDKNGQHLKVGDRVTVECEVTSVDESDYYCNLSLKTVEKMPPSNEQTGYISLNAKQVVKVACLLLCLLTIVGVFNSAAHGQSSLSNYLLPQHNGYREATEEAIRRGLPLVVFVDCELMPVVGNHIMYRASAEEWEGLGGKRFKGAIYAKANVDGVTMRITKRVPAALRVVEMGEVRPMATPFAKPFSEQGGLFKFPPFEALLKGLPPEGPGLVVDDSSKAVGPWPKDVPFVRGLVHYKPTKVTQVIDKLNSNGFLTSRIYRASRFNKTIETKWHQPGGLEGIKGWQSHLYKLVPDPGAREFKAGIVVANGNGNPGYQTEVGFKREYPVGTIFVDSLSYQGKPFELRVAEKVEKSSSRKDGWHRYVAFRDRSARPPGYHGLKQLCVSCHNTVNNPFAMTGNGPGAGKYTGGLIPGGDTVVSDPFRGF